VHVRVRLFASLREAAGRSELVVELPAGARVEDAWRLLVEAHPPLRPRRASLAAALDGRYVEFEAPLFDGSELVFIPPVSGG
jgi:molybdopterin converting factor subunit 1